MFKKNIFLISAFLIIFLVLLISVFLLFYYRGFNINNYYAVYLKTGDIYFGKLSRFPSLTLSNVWYLRSDSQGELSISRFDQSVWGPEDKLKINNDQVVWIAKISPTSQIFSVISGKSSNLPLANPSSNSFNSNGSGVNSSTGQSATGSVNSSQ